MAALFVIYLFPLTSVFGAEILFTKRKRIMLADTTSKEGTVKTVSSKEVTPIN
jgi:hypothetical protein